MPQYLPLGAFRQGLLPGDCRACAWWQTSGAAAQRGDVAVHKRHEWITDLEHDWGYVGLLVHEQAGRRATADSGDYVISASIHFAPAASLARFRELPFPPLPASSALLFCFHADEDAPRWVAKRLIRKAIYELRSRGVQEVYAVAHWPEGCGDPGDCRFFSTELLAANGFQQVFHDGHLCLMRVDNRGLISLFGQVETAFRSVFASEQEPAPSPAAWAYGENRAEQGAP
jgi:hypothetical protein